MRIWNELMIQGHPQGAGPLVGRQIRYLVESEHGILGGFGFSSAALHLEDRDRWIGWDWKTRQANLHHVVGMSRFLIRSTVSCQNLASKLLGMVVQRFPEDFSNRYHHRPLLLESFVDISSFKGTCYRASNWQWVGRTKGRGRQDRRLARAPGGPRSGPHAGGLNGGGDLDTMPAQAWPTRSRFCSWKTTRARGSSCRRR